MARPNAFYASLSLFLATGCFDPGDGASDSGNDGDVAGDDSTTSNGSAEDATSADGGDDDSGPGDETEGGKGDGSSTSTDTSTSGEAGTDTTATDASDGTTGTGEGSSSEDGPSTDTPPEVMILEPSTDLVGGESLFYDAMEGNLWYTDVTLRGMATDAEDGDLSSQIQWETDLVDIQSAALGDGAEVTVRLYSDDCYGVTHTITATVTDSDGNAVDSASRQIRIYTIC